MRKALILSTVFALAFGISSMAQADDTTSTSMAPAANSTMAPATNTMMAPTSTTTAPVEKHHMSKHHGPCMAVASACEDAGFRLSKKTPGKNIWHDCVKPLVAGQSISGVTVDPKDLDACKMHMAQKKDKKMMMDKAQQPSTPPSVNSQQ